MAATRSQVVQKKAKSLSMVLSQCSRPGLPDCWTDFKRVTSLSKWVWCNIFFIKTCLKYEVVTELSLNELGGSPKFETQASGAGLKTGFRCSYLKADGWNGWKQYWFHLFTWHKQTLKVLINFHSIPSKKKRSHAEQLLVKQLTAKNWQLCDYK